MNENQYTYINFTQGSKHLQTYYACILPAPFFWVSSEIFRKAKCRRVRSHNTQRLVNEWIDQANVRSRNWAYTNWNQKWSVICSVYRKLICIFWRSSGQLIKCPSGIADPFKLRESFLQSIYFCKQFLVGLFLEQNTLF